MRVLILGCGSAGRRHAANAKLLGHEAIVFDVDEAASTRAAIALSCERIPTGDGRPWACHPDAAVIATPAAVHLDDAREAVRRGIPVYIEKPLGIIEQLAEWEALATRPLPSVVYVGYQLRFQDQAMALRLGAVGNRVRGASFSLACDPRQWRGLRATYADPLLECSHEIDLARWFGASDLTSADVREHRVVLGFGSVGVDIDWRAPYAREWRIEGEHFKGRAHFDRPEALGEAMYLDALSEFFAAQAAPEHRSRAATLADGIEALRLCAEIRQLKAVD